MSAKPATPYLRLIPSVYGYAADRAGNIWSMSNWRGYGPRIVKPFINNHGYYTVRVSIEGKRTGYVSHKLVCMAWHGEPMEGEEVRHLDGNRLNNRPSNLKWGTRKENALDRSKHGRCKSGENGRKAIKKMIANGTLIRKPNGTMKYKGAK